jgi:hypothetical protein
MISPKSLISTMCGTDAHLGRRAVSRGCRVAAMIGYAWNAAETGPLADIALIVAISRVASRSLVDYCQELAAVDSY